MMGSGDVFLIVVLALCFAAGLVPEMWEMYLAAKYGDKTKNDGDAP